MVELAEAGGRWLVWWWRWCVWLYCRWSDFNQWYIAVLLGTFGIGGNGGAGQSGTGSINAYGSSGAGGSSYVYSEATASYVNGVSNQLGTLYMTSTSTSTGSSTIPTTDGTSMEIGHSGNGYVKITTLK